MADTSSGGCVRSATRSSARVRPCASASGTCSEGSGEACSRILASASATDSNAMILIPGAVRARLAAVLFQHADVLDAHVALCGFHHIVDREAGDRYRRQ